MRMNDTLPPDNPSFPQNLVDALTGYGHRAEPKEPENPLELMEPVSVATALAIMEAARLTEREQRVILLRYLDGLDLVEAGKRFGVTRERIRQVEAKALHKMLRPSCREILQKGFYRWTLDEIEHRAENIAVEKIMEFKRAWAEEHNAEPVVTEEPVYSGDSVLSQPIEWLDLSVRLYNCLKRANIDTVRDLTERTADSMFYVRNLGRKSLDEIREKLNQYELSFADEPKKHAMWVPSNNADYAKCSNCGAWRRMGYDGQWCPGCGAKMDGSVAK